MQAHRRLKDCLITVALIAAVALPAHFYIADRLRVLQFLYPLEAFAARLTVSCSSTAPDWMPAALKASTAFSPGGQLAYIDDSGKLHQCVMGWRGDTLISERITTESYFRLASLTKVATSLAYATLEQSGSLNPQDRVLERLALEGTVADARVAQMQISHLHQHTAGFDRHATPDPMFRRNQRSWCPSALEKLRQTELDFAPGEKTVYSNLAYCLLGEIIAKTQQSDYRSAVAELLQLPSYDLEFIDGPYLAREIEYDFRNTGFYGPNYYRDFNFKDASAAISLTGTAASFARLVFDHTNLLTPLLSLDLDELGCDAERLRTCHFLSMQAMRRPSQGLLTFSHAGNVWGASAFMMLDEHGGVMTWAGKGSPSGKPGQFDELKWEFYDLLDGHYRRSR